MGKEDIEKDPERHEEIKKDDEEIEALGNNDGKGLEDDNSQVMEEEKTLEEIKGKQKSF